MLINNALEKYEKQREDELIQAFGAKTLYEKYNAILGKSNLYEIYAAFKKEYGDVWAFSRTYGKVLKTKFLDTVKIKAGLITDEVEKKNVLQPLEMDLTLLFDIPVYKNTRKNCTSHKYIGHAKLLTNGRIIKVEYEANNKAYAIPEENFEKCFIEVESKDENRKLVKNIRGLVETTEQCCLEYGYALEKNLVDNVMAFMDIKNILKNAGKA